MTGGTDLQSRVAVMEHRQDKFEDAVQDIRDNLVKLSANLEIISRIDERQANQRDQIKTIFKRLQTLEEHVPANTLARTIGGRIGLVLIGLGGSAIGAMMTLLVAQ